MSLDSEEPPLHQVLRGKADPRLPHLQAFLGKLECPAREPWLDAANTMARTLELARVEELRLASRLDVRGALEQLATAAKRIIAVTDRDDVLEALRVPAPVAAHGPDDVTGYEYLRALAHRAETAANAIRSGPGKDTFLAGIGYPTPRLLCAVMVRTAWTLAKGKAPSEKTQRRLKRVRRSAGRPAGRHQPARKRAKLTKVGLGSAICATPASE